MTKGWKGEPKRHAKSAKGVKTGRKLFRRKTDVGYYDSHLKSPEYLKKSNARKIYIKYMTPKKYLQESAKIQETSEGRQREMVYEPLVDKYVKRSVAGEKMPMPYLNYVDKEQEGRHRAVVAERQGAKKIPVAIVKKMSDKEYDEYMKVTHPETYKYFR